MNESKHNKTRIKELESLILYHQNAYYNREPEITDYEFDKLWDELKVIDPDNHILHTVGKDNFGFKKVRHIMPMGSQAKAASPNEFEAWFNRMVKEGEKLFIAQYKMDGLSIELQYENGRLTHAVTRGDGESGDDVTDNILKTGCVIPSIPGIGEGELFNGAIRGEVLLSHKMKDTFFADKKNCRNAAVGCLKRKDGQGCEYLHIIVYDAFTTDENKRWSCEEEKVHWLNGIGYEVAPTEKFIKCKDIIDYRNDTEIYRRIYNYDIDGIVVKCNNYSLEDMKRDRPNKQIAFKFNLDEIRTTLLNVEWCASGKRRTPVAVCTPVKIGGSTVARANLANYGLIKKLGLKIGDTVIMVKRGEIIPKIIGVVNTEPNNIAKEVVPPKRCEYCGTSLISDGVNIVCPNEMCSGQIFHRIMKWINTVEIKFIGESTVHKMISRNLVKSPSDLYEPSLYVNLMNYKIVGTGMGQKIIDNINRNKNVTLPVFIGGLDIDNVGVKLIETLVEYGFDTIDKIRNASIQDLCKCTGIHTILAAQIKNGMAEREEEIAALLDCGITIIGSNSRDGKFRGITACFTGSFNRHSRTELEKMVIAGGGKVINKVSRNTSFLVSNDKGSNSAKSQAAKLYNIAIIDEEKLLELAS